MESANYKSLITLDHELYLTGTDNWVQTTGVGGYSFFTCYSENSITFDFYVTPFQPEIWCALLTGYVSIALALSLWMFTKKIENSFCPWLYVLGALLEDGVPIPGKFENSLVFRFVFGCWIIVCVFLSNFYNGIMITGLNSPLAATSVNTFRDLVCDYQKVKYSYKEYANMTNHFEYLDYFSVVNFYLEFYISQLMTLYNPESQQDANEKFFTQTSKCFSILSLPDENVILPKLVLYVINLYSAFTSRDWNLQIIELELNIFYPRQRLFPRDVFNLGNFNYSKQVGYVEKELVDCGQTAFAATPNELEAEVEYLSRAYPGIKFFKSKETLMTTPSGIGIDNPGVSKIPRHANSLVESGIHSRLMKEKHKRRNFKREQSGIYKPRREEMTMDGCISTLFILCGGLAGVSTVVFGAECCNRVKGRIFSYISEKLRCFCRKQKSYCTKSLISEF